MSRTNLVTVTQEELKSLEHPVFGPGGSLRSLLASRGLSYSNPIRNSILSSHDPYTKTYEFWNVRVELAGLGRKRTPKE